MKRRLWILILCLLVVAGAWLFWSHSSPPTARPLAGSGPGAAAVKLSAPKTGGASAVTPLNTNKLSFRLSNTTNSLKQLTAAPHAILLANAFIDTEKPVDLKIPAHLRDTGNPGAYIVQARRAVDAPFRSALAAAGAQIVSYIPNNAYLVRATASGADALAGNPLVQAVLPYEPYYKLQSSLLGLAVEPQALPPGTALNLGLFAADAAAAEAQLAALGVKIIGRDHSAFGPVLRVLAPADWTALAQVPGVQILEPAHARVAANDLSRVTAGIAADTLTATNYLNLSGSNVLVVVNDSGIDATHPDLAPRVTGLTTNDTVDTVGHGTHVAGIIGSSGVNSINLTGISDPTDVGTFAQGSVPHADFRGKAPLVNLFAIKNGSYSDYQLQTNAAMVGAPISNNSWDYGNGAAEYDLAAASYDWATRDALPGTTGSQPVLFVFAAGNSGGGDNDGQEGSGDTILSPGTAKNVITVGALEQVRNITNWVTWADGTSNRYWLPWTDAANQVAWYSSRGNVGIGTEGNYGRFKPDVVSPGTFVVSTRSQQWDTNAYYNATNDVGTYYADQVVTTNFPAYYNVLVPPNAIAVIITVIANQYSNPLPPNMPIYVQQSAYPDPVGAPGSIDIIGTNMISIPPATGGAITGIQALQGNGFDIAVGDPTDGTVNFDLSVQIWVTNNLGNLEIVLEGMNEQLAPYYRYETGTSMAAADVSGVLALVQDYFTNKLSLTPSPALMKALLINGSRKVGNYTLAVTNAVNFQGWGLDNIQNIVPVGGLTSQFAVAGSSFFVDQNPTNALATGDSHTYLVTVATNNSAAYFPLRATLVWTDPPGDPAAAIKLVNNLDLVITNLVTGEVYFGNDISPNISYNRPWNTNAPPNLDVINNVENILLPPFLAGSYSVTVVGRAVNVNAVTAQTNNQAGVYAPNIVQDYALVIAVGEGEVTNAFTVTDNAIVSNPTGDQDITVVTSTNAPLFNQMVGASSPLLGTNTVPLGTNTVWGSGGVLTIGMTNQWHFYIVTNSGPTLDYTNAAFITFDPYTLSIPRMGVFADSVANATRPEADIDLFVTTDPNLLLLSPLTISNCLAGVGNSGASVGQGGTEYVYFTNSTPGQVYYVGVQSQDQMASEYAFLPVFTDIPFSQLDKNGNQVVSGMLLPVNIPDGDNAHPGVTNVFALAVMPMEVAKVTVTNLNEHQNFGDLFGALSFGGQYTVLNNHDGYGNTYGTAPRVYDDSRNPVAGTQHSDGPGSLVNFRGKSALGPWILGEMDNSLTMTGRVTTFSLLIQPHRKLTAGTTITVPPGGWFIDYVDVPPGYTNLTFSATNMDIPPLQPAIQMYEKFGNEPTLADYDQTDWLTNCLFGTYPSGTYPGNSISVGPPLATGQYFIGLYNPNPSTAAQVYIIATLGIDTSASDLYNYTSASPTNLLDDAVSSSTIAVPNTVTQLVASVNVGIYVNSPRISDYTFTLVSPTGQRVLLMENRGAADTNGAGAEFIYTNVLNSTATGGAAAQTNYLTVPITGITVPITYNFYTVPDEMTVYLGTNIVGTPWFDTGFTNNVSAGPGAQNTVPVTVDVPVPPGYTNITIIMNQFGNPYVNGGGDAWTYTAGATFTNFQYLEFTDDTNLATVPIKYAQPPFNFAPMATNYVLTDFTLATNGDYLAPNTVNDAFGGWTLATNQVTYTTVLTNGQAQLATNILLLTNNLVSVINDPASSLTGDTSSSNNFLALAQGTITRSIATVPGRTYNVTFWYRGPGIEGWWRGEGNASDSSDPENNNNNGTLIGRFNFPAGEVGQAFQFADNGSTFQFAATNTYVQIPATASLNVGAGGGFTVEGWINPTNLSRPQPLVEWLAHVPTNSAATNVVIVQGPVLNPATGHYYYLLAATNWTVSEQWAQQLGGHLATIETANEENWVYDTFTAYGTLNRDLWIGLAFTNATGNFGWTSGQTNLPYSNWLTGQPGDCGNNYYYTAILGPTNALPGLWVLADNKGLICGSSAATNTIYGVVEVDDIPTNGVQLWISGTNNTPGGTNVLRGCLYANIVDTNYVSHEIFSAPGLLQSNVYQHVALTFNTNSGIAALYLNGTNVATTNLFTAGGSFVPKTDGDLLLGWDMSRSTNNFYGGMMDEMSLYSRALSRAEISAIYQVSAFSTNRLIGKFDPSVTPAVGLAEALVSFGANSNVIFGVNNQWEVNSYTFTATSNSMPLQISGIEPGILLDQFSVAESPQTNLYYLPEQELSALTGSSAAGSWTLQVWDNRAGAFVTNVDQLVSWQLSFVLQSNAVVSASLPPQTPVATTVPAGQTVYYSVTVPIWAHAATNILVSANYPVDLLYFNPLNSPAKGNAADLTLLTNATSGIGTPILVTNGTPPLLPGQTYYLGVRNNNSYSASVTLEVDYDITVLTNGIAYNSSFATNDTFRYFEYDVSSNAYEATFQLLNLSANADLVVRKGAPLPTLTSSSYGSFNVSNIDENIYVFTNSAPVSLSAGRWYLGVFKRDSGVVNYSVLAKELDYQPGITNIIDLTNGVPFNWTAGPGASLTNFFRFGVSNNPSLTNAQGLRFELYNLSGNGDLTLQTNALPLAPPFFQSSQNPGRSPELILVFTNSALTNLAADWYLGVPNHETQLITYTIVAVIETNSYFPAFPGAAGAGGGALGGRGGDVYHVTTNGDSIFAIPGSLRAAINSATNSRTVVFDISGNITLVAPLVITNSDLTIAGQTAPGGGITVVGSLTTFSNVHQVVIRDVRFRSGTTDDSLQFLNASNVIADHISTAWSADNLVSVLNSANVTVQWSIMADSLTNNGQGFGSLLRYGSGALSFHHNLYADNNYASPRLGDNISLDFVNNVIYNWGNSAGYSLDDSANNSLGFTNQLNYTCNYLIAGSNSVLPTIAFSGGTPNTWIFQTNNFMDSDLNGVLNGANTQLGMFANLFTPVGHIFPLIPVPTDEAFLAYEKVLDFAGVNLEKRDPVDHDIVDKVRNQSGALINNSPGTSPVPPTSPLFLDTDQDGVPDFWEITFGTDPFTPSNNQLSLNVNFIGYSDLEEYLAWLAVPHALTVTNTPVGVDLMQLCGKTGHLSFFVTNAVNGSVYLTNLFANVMGVATNIVGSVAGGTNIAVFVPTNSPTNFYGYASFDLYVTNNDTAAYFGPVTVSVVVSAVVPAVVTNTTIVTLTNQTTYTPGCNAGGSDYYHFVVSSNAAGVQFKLDNSSSGQMTLVARHGLPLPSLSSYDYLTNLPPPPGAEVIYVDTNSTGGQSVAGDWYLAAVNVSGSSDCLSYSIQATELAPIVPPEFTFPANAMVTNILETVPFTMSCVAMDLDSPPLTNNFYLVGIVSVPAGLNVTNLSVTTNGILNWTPTEAQGPSTNFVSICVWNTNGLAINPKTYSVTNTFTIVVEESNLPPTFVFTNIPDQIISALNLLTVTNTATDADIPVNSLTYQLLVQSADTNAQAVTNAFINFTNGIVTWMPTLAQAGTNYLFTTIVTDTNPWAVNAQSLSATNYFNVFVLPNLIGGQPGQPVINVVATNSINWFAVYVPTNAIYATNILLSASAPVTIWFSTNVPPTTNVALMAGVTSGISVLSTNLATAPTNIVQGTTYYLGVQNLNAVPVTNVLEVDFALVYPFPPPVFVFTNIPDQVITVGDTLIVTNNATDTNAGAVLVYYLTNSPAGAWIDTNGIITWATTTNLVPVVPTNVVITTIVTDTNTALSATNSFNVLVLPALVNQLPQTNVVVANGIEWYEIKVPTNAFAATNTLLFATAPVNLWYSSTAPPSITTTNDVELLTNSMAGTNVINYVNTTPLLVAGGIYYLGVQNTNSFAITNAVEVTFDLAAAVPPALPNIPNQSVAGGDTLVVTNTATDINAGVVLAYFLTDSPAGASIDPNGIITWPTTTNIAPTNVVITTIVTDTFTLLTATNSFMVSVLPSLINGQPETNTVANNSINWYLIKVPTNAIAATNSLLFASAPVNLWFSTSVPPTITNVADFELLTNLTSGDSVISTNTTPLLVPGSKYYLGVQNSNAVPVNYGVKVTFLLVSTPPPIFSISSVVNTNLNGTNGWLVTWFAPTNYQFHLQWTASLLPTHWHTFNGVISFLSVNTATNALFQYFDNGERYYDNGSPVTGSPTDGLDAPRFYRLQLLNSPTNTPPLFLNTLTKTPPQFINPLVTLTVTNDALDWDFPAQTLTYRIINSLAGTNLASIDTNGVITWTPALAQGGLTNVITTIVTDNGVPAKHTTNVMVVVVVAVPTPYASALPAKAVTGTSALLNGFATPNGTNSTAWFEWGASRFYGSTTPPVNVGGGSNVVYLTAPIAGLINGQNYHCRLVVSNRYYTVRSFDQQFGTGHLIDWGHDDYGQLGQTGVPAGLGSVVGMDIGYASSVALMPDGTVSAWGIDFFHLTEVPTGLNNAVAVSLAKGDFGDTCMALKSDGTVAVWGDNSYGQLNLPASLTNVVAVSAGNWHNLALKADGTVVAWGTNFNASIAVPASLSNVVAIAAGDSHNLALKNDGTVFAWGYDAFGQTEVPAGLTNVAAVAAGSYHSLALKSDGTVIAWGDNFDGETNVPAGLNNVVEVAGGGYHSLAVKSDGTVVAWGADSSGQIDVPASVTNAVAVAGAYYKSLALVSANPLTSTNPPPASFSIGSISTGINGASFQWSAPVYEAFQMRWTTNLVPPVWNIFPDIITSTNGSFNFTDTNASALMKFYQLILLP